MLDVDDTKYYQDSQGAKEAEGVRKITNVISNQMNPFTCEDEELINISTGQKATSADLINAREKGLEALAVARTDSEKVARIKLSTFTAKLKKSMTMEIKAKKVYEEDSAVVRNLYFVQDLEEDTEVEVFDLEWMSCPFSLFVPDPSLDQSYAMRKGNKADYPSDEPVVIVVDAMVFIQRYQNLGSSTFHELQRKYLRQLLGILSDKCDCIHFVGDLYDVSPADSLK